MRAKLKEAGKKGYMIYALCDELREESEAKDKLIEELRRKCETYESDIEKMKCCQNCDNSRYTEQGTTCADDDLECDDLSHWVLRR